MAGLPQGGAVGGEFGTYHDLLSRQALAASMTTPENQLMNERLNNMVGLLSEIKINTTPREVFR